MKYEISPSDKSLIDLSSKIYDKSQLAEIVEFDGTINELNGCYPIECLREDNGTYRASYLADGSIAVVQFDELGCKIWANIYTPQLLKSDFERLIKGQVLKDVREMDPNGEYLFLYTGRDDMPKISSHYTKDGYLITIEYDESNTIVNINISLI